MRPSVHILIPAAGASSRMRGKDKLLQNVAGRPLVRHSAETALATGAPVLVTLPPDTPRRREALAGLDLTIVAVPDAAQGMSRSLVRGLDAITGAGPQDGLMILPADMPDFTVSALGTMIRAFCADPQTILRGAAGSVPGHPVIFPRALWPDLARLTGDEGGRSILANHADRLRLVGLPGRMAVTDLDTPEDWRDWQTLHP